MLLTCFHMPSFGFKMKKREKCLKEKKYVYFNEGAFRNFLKVFGFFLCRHGNNILVGTVGESGVKHHIFFHIHHYPGL